jgi:hypothetical protein
VIDLVAVVTGVLDNSAYYELHEESFESNAQKK